MTRFPKSMGASTSLSSTLEFGVHLEMKTVAGGLEAEAAKKRVACDFLADEREPGSGVLKAPSPVTFEVNLLGVVYGLKLAVHHMK